MWFSSSAITGTHFHVLTAMGKNDDFETCRKISETVGDSLLWDSSIVEIIYLIRLRLLLARASSHYYYRKLHRPVSRVTNFDDCDRTVTHHFSYIAFFEVWCVGAYKARTQRRQSRIRHGTLCRKSTVSLWPRRPTYWRQSRKDVRHSGDKNYPLSTKSTELNMNFGDNVDRDTVDKVERAGDSRLSTNRRQSRQSSLSPVLATVDFVAMCTGL